MSLLGALNSAVSALHAQSQAIAMISDNLANASTPGYKTTSASFAELVTGSSARAYSSGGVVATARADVSAQGLLTQTGTATNVAILGNGFFPVRNGTDGSAIYYTRNGDFRLDSSGFLTNNGYTLLGWRTDADGNVIGGETAGALQPIDANVLSSIASPTTKASLSATLPAD